MACWFAQIREEEHSFCDWADLLYPLSFDEAIMALPCLVDDETRAAMRVNKDINRELERWKRDQSKEYKLLLLGKRNFV